MLWSARRRGAICAAAKKSPEFKKILLAFADFI
jgi:hypothetical protein